VSLIESPVEEQKLVTAAVRFLNTLSDGIQWFIDRAKAEAGDPSNSFPRPRRKL
jgi:hypothetical protein